MSAIQSSESKSKLIMRLKRVEGQLRGVRQMIENDADSAKVAQQLSAGRRALEQAMYQLLACAVSEHVNAKRTAGTNARGQEAPAFLSKFL
jgi:CsoR family transcriptional regulator, copper-sensing transcriptional repressor